MQPGNVLITGAAARIGRAMALSLARDGWNVGVHYSSSRDAALTTANEIRGMGPKAEILQADLLQEDEIEALVPAAVKALSGPLTLLINNASIFEPDTVDCLSRSSWDRHMMSNLRAPMILTQDFAAQSPEVGRGTDGRPLATGAVINMIDMRVRKLTPKFMTYTLAKSALWTFTQTSAQALAPAIRVNGIGPGPTLKAERQTEEQFLAQQAATPLERGSDPEGIVEAMQFILRSTGLTGQLLCIDGGQHLGWQTKDILGIE